MPNLPWNETVKRYLHLEELGFDIAGTGDHFVNWSNPHDTQLLQIVHQSVHPSENGEVSRATRKAGLRCLGVSPD